MDANQESEDTKIKMEFTGKPEETIAASTAPTTLVIIPQHAAKPTPANQSKVATDVTSNTTTVNASSAGVTLAATTQSKPIQLQAPMTTHVPNINAPIPISTHQQAGTPPKWSNFVIVAANPGQPGDQMAIRYPIQAINQSNIFQGNPTLIRGINPSQIIRAQASSSGVMQTQTSQVQTTTMANLQGRPVQIQQFRPTGSRGPITLSNGQTIVPMRHQMMTSRATILQQPTLIKGVPQQGMAFHPVIPTSQPLGLGVQTPMGTQIVHQGNFINSTATAPSQMTPEDALKKGTSFFNSLLTKMNIKAKKIIMQNLIQALIDGKKTSEEFASALQKELNSGPQTQLVPFLDLLLPNLRQSMNAGITKLPGIRPPNAQESVSLPQLSQQQLPQTPQQQQQPGDSSPSTSSPYKVQSTPASQKKKKIPLPPGQKSAYAIKKEAREAKKKEKEFLAAQAAAAAQGIKTEPGEPKKETEKVDKLTKPKADKPKRQDKQKKQEKQLESLSSTLRDDDDVNDVAAMGGVNLAEESQRIMASGAELVGTQIRSCKDEPFLDTNALSSRIAKIANKYNLTEPLKDVVTLISHATQERLKNMVERLGILAEHRSENLKLHPKYEPSNDIKGQIKFLAELDRIEKRRYEEQERELLLRVAKSRSKAEDPEQQKLRQKAKDMQRAEQEEVRQREANETALLAIGPRKKLKTSTTSSVSSFSQVSSLKDNKVTIDMRGDTVRRIKRVNMRDLQVLLELDRTHLNRLIKFTAQ